MEDELIVTCNFPFKRCTKCKELKLETNLLYSDDTVAVIVMSCENKEICQNAYDIWKGEESGKNLSVN